MTARHATALAIALALAACGPSNNNQDAGPGSDGPPADASLFGTECQTDSDCPNGYCVDGFGGQVCTFECTAPGGCPQNWDCRTTPVDGNPVSVCVPPAFELCTPCSADAQCGAGVCVSLGGEGYCLPQCPFEGSCPQGYSCGPDPSGMNEGQYCVPMTSACTCTSGAQLGQLRTCTKANAIGTCRGLETCDPSAGGWMGCTAPSAAAELCDGIDNDCNGLVDDGTSGQTCQVTVAGVGSCPGVTVCTGSGGAICQGRMPQTETCNAIDDDCDLMTDEGYPGLNTACSAGIGGCQRFGLMRCTAAGTGTECSVVAGPPGAEQCNNVDDNCNGSVDEAFPTKGQACSVGVGACVRQGNEVCAASGAGTTCSVTPGPAGTESCNTIDDDCDSFVDEDFKDAGGQFTRDRACGSCAVDCTAIYGLPNAFGTCAAGPQCVMNCVPGAFDLDGTSANGCEFLIDATGVVYVSADDPGSADDATCGLGPVGTGAGRHPCRTIGQGIARAQALGFGRVLVANGIYAEGVTLANGISLLGGHRPDNWVRDIAATGTVISGSTVLGGVHDATVNASNITMPTILEGFAIYGSVNPKARGNSYAIYASNSSASLAIRSNVILGGRGGPGASGASGTDGAAGGEGGGRAITGGTDSMYDAKIVFGATACSSTEDRVYSKGGASVCGGDDVSGGNGGGNRCPASPQSLCTGCVCNATVCGCASCTFVSTTASDGLIGQPGNGPGGGAAGVAGTKGEDLINKMLFDGVNNNQICFIPDGRTYGTDGTDGINGAHGAPVGGCMMTSGAVSNGHWVGAVAAGGVPGANGGGGGGGGAGGGSHCDGCQSGFDNFGGHGGGGGGGGCGGAGG
ncbi:MAG: hypothetical protein JNL83_25840, partial [Myxococcales bacterium]|nr:hypothetical protein [Myxococcales bacterium]